MAAAIIAGGLPAIAQPYDPPPSAFTAYWEVTAFKDYPLQGPQKAIGMVFWSHGVAGKFAQYQYPPPEIIKDFAAAGWDVAKIQRNNTHENGWSASGTRHVADLIERVNKARADGYRFIVAAGQSYGGAISLEAGGQTDALFGIIAFAPGHGSDACGPNAGQSHYRMADNLQRQLAQAIERVKAPRIVVLVADGDECQGFNEPSRLIREALEKTPGSYLHFDASLPIRGHGAANTSQFRTWYSECLRAFIDPAREPASKATQCAAPDPRPRFLFDAGFRFPTAPATEATAHAKLIGAWSGTVGAANHPVVRDICIVVSAATEQLLETKTAFGAGPDAKYSMVTASRDYKNENGSYVYRGPDSFRMTLKPNPSGDAVNLAVNLAGGHVYTGVLKPGC